MKIFFLARSLEAGGAERQLVALVNGLDKRLFQPTVGLFYDRGPLRKDVEGGGNIALVSLHKQGRWDVVASTIRLVRLLRKLQPHVIHGYLPDANLLALLAGRLARVPVVVWGIRASNMDLSRYGLLPRLVFWAAGKLSGLPDLIISNSTGGSRFHQSQGYDGRRMRVVFNGIDTDTYLIDRGRGKVLRQQWGCSDDEVLIGLVGRLDPMKGHDVFLDAAARLARDRPNVRFLCVGDGSHSYRRSLEESAAQLGVGGRMVWVTHHSDMPTVYNALDILTSASVYGEGFSNVIGEAMACGIPCVATDVGDARAVLGDTGLVVQPGSANELYRAWKLMLGLPESLRREMGERARTRVVAFYAVSRMVEETSRLLEEAVEKAQGKGHWK